MFAPVVRTISRPSPERKQPTAARRPLIIAARPSTDLFAWAGVSAPRRDIVTPFNPQRLVKLARGIWHVSMPAQHSVLAERWAALHGITLPADISDAVRFHANLRNGDARSPGLVLLLRDLFDDAPCGIVRIYLDDAGNVIGRRTLGRVYNAAIKLDADENVCAGLHVAAGIEIAIAAMHAGIRPIWALTSTSALASFPILSGVESLTIITGPDDEPAVAEVAIRWRAAGCEVNARPP